MKAAESVRPDDANVTEDEIVVVLERLKSLDADRLTATPSRDVFRSLRPSPSLTPQL